MVSTFLKAEINSSRFKKGIFNYLTAKNIQNTLIIKPNLKSSKENMIRRDILSVYRGYGKNRLVFDEFPTDIKWYQAEITKDEIKKIKYMNHDYWTELSDNSRLARIAAENIKVGKTVFNVPNNNFLEAAEALKRGVKFPEMILVSKDKKSDPVILEGHLRLTAMALVPESVPDNMTVIIGFSNNIVNWGFY
jgi:hypothetical protein